MPNTYAFDAAGLLQQCLQELQDVIEANERRGHSHYALYDMKEAMLSTERLLCDYFQQILEQERITSSSRSVQALYAVCPPTSLSSSISLLRSVLKDKKLKESKKERRTKRSGDSQSQPYYENACSTGLLLFRLHVALQLCLVRIDDARVVVTGRRRERASTVSTAVATHAIHVSLALTGCVGTMGFFSVMMHRHRVHLQSRDYLSLFLASAKIGVATLTGNWLRKSWGNMWMTNKAIKSASSIEDWNEQWHLVQLTARQDYRKHAQQTPSNSDATSAITRRLVEYALNHTPESSFWHSQGELRFLMLKRAMDVFYASVGTAMKVTDPALNWQMTVTAAAAASFYSLTGASRRAAEETSSSSARDLIQSAWGMVSLPAIKNLSLQASRILKGAAVADRIEIMGISCFILSKEPAPELAAAIKRWNRKHRRTSALQNRLSTIDEGTEHAPDILRSMKPFARSCGHYRQRDVIFHLTGGGFFAHIIASDLPFLLDWSASTGAVVICPEYALLPDHRFPDALHQVEDVYRALRWGDALATLGFEVNRLVVTGESAGGNLAAALCVKLCLDNAILSKQYDTVVDDTADIPLTESEEESEDLFPGLGAPSPLPLPDALMLSTAVLNLSLELSYSRVVGTEDPVLPSGLILAISDAYLPAEAGIDKKDPLASPFFATDAVLCQFPPTLLFASSTDPLLDDSVVFNQRLQSLGVESNLRAAQNLPHAYLGLGTAGFPEAQKVQKECMEWLSHQFTRNDGDEKE